MKELRFYENFYFVTYRYGKLSRYNRWSGSPFHYFNCVLRGRGRIITKDDSLEVKAGDMYYLPKGLAYESWWYSDDYVEIASCGTAVFPEAHNAPFFPPGQEAKHFPQDWGTSASHGIPFRLQLIPERFHQELLNIPRDCVPNTHTLALFFAWLDKLIPCLQREDQDPGTRMAKKVRAYIDNNPGCRIPDIAQHCGISESALYSTIRKATGKTPNELRQTVLVEKAVHMLITTNKSIQTISDLLAFSSPTYFRKIIHDHTGKSPTQLRNEGKEEKEIPVLCHSEAQSGEG